MQESCCVKHTRHVDVDAAILRVVSTVEACVQAGVHCGGLLHSDGGDKQATVVLLRLLRDIQRRLPGQLRLSPAGQGERSVERHHHLLRLWQQHRR